MKKRFGALCNLKPGQLNVNAVPSKRPNTWVGIRIRPLPQARIMDPLAYPGEIPVLYRRIALAVAYGPGQVHVEEVKQPAWAARLTPFGRASFLTLA